jgi:hypothetical protein
MLNLDISLGNVLTIASFMIGGLWFISTMRGAVDMMALRLSTVETEVKKLAEVLITLGKYEERFTRLERDINDLRHGQGYIITQRKRQTDTT